MPKKFFFLFHTDIVVHMGGISEQLGKYIFAMFMIIFNAPTTLCMSHLHNYRLSLFPFGISRLFTFRLCDKEERSNCWARTMTWHKMKNSTYLQPCTNRFILYCVLFSEREIYYSRDSKRNGSRERNLLRKKIFWTIINWFLGVYTKKN